MWDMTSAVGRAKRPDEDLDLRRLQELMINDGGFAFNPQTGQTYSINPTGVDVIHWLNEGFGLDKVIVRMQDEFEIDEFTATQDFHSFVDSLRQNGLL